jgi:hypothetical protein
MTGNEVIEMNAAGTRVVRITHSQAESDSALASGRTTLLPVLNW